MKHLPKSVTKAIEEFSKLPGIGPKSAGRLVFHLIRQPGSASESLGQALLTLKETLRFCSTCYNITEADPCLICADQTRDSRLLAVVEQPLDTVAIEKTEFNGRYHVLGGAISPIDGIGPGELRMNELMRRLQSDQSIAELILATNPTLEGEATALYLKQQIDEQLRDRLPKLRLSRIAHGLPVGGDLEYADAVTLTRSFEGRRTL